MTDAIPGFVSEANRKVFDSAVQELVDEGVIEVVAVSRGERYRLKDDRQGGSGRQGMLTQLNEGGGARQGGESTNVISLESHKSQQTGEPKLSCQKWFDNYLAKQRAQGHNLVEGALCGQREWPRATTRTTYTPRPTSGDSKGRSGSTRPEFLPERGVSGRTRRNVKPSREHPPSPSESDVRGVGRVSDLFVPNSTYWAFAAVDRAGPTE